MRLINIGLISRWQNWITVLLMLIIATFAINAVTKFIIGDNTNGN